jgi:hypothetical protein
MGGQAAGRMGEDSGGTSSGQVQVQAFKELERPNRMNLFIDQPLTTLGAPRVRGSLASIYLQANQD